MASFKTTDDDTEFEKKIKNYKVSYEEVKAEVEKTGNNFLFYLYDYYNDEEYIQIQVEYNIARRINNLDY